MLVLSLLACSSIDAPEALEDLMVYGLLNFEDRRSREQFTERAVTELSAYEDALKEGLRVDSLTSEDLLSNGLSTEIPPNGEVLGVATTLSFESDFDDVVRVLTGDMSLVAPNTRTYVTTGVEPADRACFLSRDCNELDFRVTREVGGFWGTALQDVEVQFRWTTRPDGVEVFMFRGLAPEPFETNSVVYRTNQHYQFYSMVDGPEGPTKLEAHWVDAEVVGVPIPDTLLADGAVNSMLEHRDANDAFVASGEEN